MNRYVGMRFMNHPKLKIIIDENYQRVLWTHTLQGGLEWNEKDRNSGQILGFCDFFDVIRPRWKRFQPRETFEVKIGDIDLEIFRTNHIPEQSNAWEASFISFGLFIDGRVFVSGDTKYDQELVDFYAPQAEVMIHDVQFFPGAVHAPLDDMKSGFSDAVKEKTYFVHYADNWEEQDISGFGGWIKQGVRYVFD